MRFLRPVVSFAAALVIFARAPDAAYAQAPAQPPLAPEAQGPTVFVHIEAGPEAELAVRSPEGRWLAFFCTAPCDRALPSDAEYWLNVAGQRSSSAFRLDASPGQRVVIRGVPASNAPKFAGVVLVATGAVAIPGGLLLALIAALSEACLGSCGTGGPSGNGGEFAVGGLVIAAAGVGALVGGAILFMQVRGAVGVRQTVADLLLPRSPERSETGWLRAPVWRDSVKDVAPGAARSGSRSSRGASERRGWRHDRAPRRMVPARSSRSCLAAALVDSLRHPRGGQNTRGISPR